MGDVNILANTEPEHPPKNSTSQRSSLSITSFLKLSSVSSMTAFPPLPLLPPLLLPPPPPPPLRLATRSLAIFIPASTRALAVRWPVEARVGQRQMAGTG